MRRYDFNVDAGEILAGDEYSHIRAAVGEIVFSAEDPRDIPEKIRLLSTKFAEQYKLNEVARLAYDMAYEMPVADSDLE